MAEGGYEFENKNPILDHDIDHDDDNDEHEVVNTTGGFQPGAASTPYHCGEIQIATMHHEQSGLPDTSYAETPLLGDFISDEDKQGFVEKTKMIIKSYFPEADFSQLGPISIGNKQATRGEMVVLGPQGGETLICKKNESGFQKSFTDKFKKSLGLGAQQILVEDRDTIQEQRQRLEEAEKQE